MPPVPGFENAPIEWTREYWNTRRLLRALWLFVTSGTLIALAGADEEKPQQMNGEHETPKRCILWPKCRQPEDSLDSCVTHARSRLRCVRFWPLVLQCSSPWLPRGGCASAQSRSSCSSCVPPSSHVSQARLRTDLGHLAPLGSARFFAPHVPSRAGLRTSAFFHASDSCSPRLPPPQSQFLATGYICTSFTTPSPTYSGTSSGSFGWSPFTASTHGWRVPTLAFVEQADFPPPYPVKVDFPTSLRPLPTPRRPSCSALSAPMRSGSSCRTHSASATRPTPFIPFTATSLASRLPPNHFPF